MIQFDKVFNLFRKVFCECKECSEIFRLSDTELSTGGSTPKDDWLSLIDKRIIDLERKIEKAEDAFAIKKEKIIQEERKKVERETFRQVNELVPNFSKIKLNMRDVKTIGFPVSFISFDGKDDGQTEKIRLIDFEPQTTTQEKRLESIGAILKKGNLEWKTLRILDTGKIQED